MASQVTVGANICLLRSRVRRFLGVGSCFEVFGADVLDSNGVTRQERSFRLSDT